MGKLFITLLFLGITVFSRSQSVVYTDYDKLTFVKLFFIESEINHAENDKRVQELYLKHGVTRKDFRALESGTREANSEFKLDMIKLNHEIAEERRQEFIEALSKWHFTLEKYDQMKQKFKDNLAFENELKPYFSQYINSVKNEK
ncbi:MAG TPA: hypothetical protein P5235_01940 [Saprospiraceae bacterium]|mgnify:FL=1|nr:hypothetical protein [Saprospiraceae bacterium]